MQYTTLGHTEVRVSVAGLGGGGFSRLGLNSARRKARPPLVLEAVDLGINFIDTAAAYGTEGVIGRALTSLQRDQVVISTKSTIRLNGERVTPEGLVASIDNSLRVMGTEISTCSICTASSGTTTATAETLAPVLDAEKRKGKIPNFGITEAKIVDHTNEMLKRALRDPVWEVFMVAFHMMYQFARTNVFAQTQVKGIGTRDVCGAQHLRGPAAHRARGQGTRRQRSRRLVARRDR